MGELLARNEVFIFFVSSIHVFFFDRDDVHSQVSLLQQTRILPPLHHPCPSPNNYISNLTRIPDDFFLRIVRA